MPVPPDYGGIVDVHFKIKALHEAGCEIYLHCFQYGRKEAPELKKWCKEVWYYPRLTGWRGVSFSIPYIVFSRRNKQLLKRLQEIDAPILFEGVHTSLYAAHPTLASRKKILRAHNIEWEYYAALAQKETNFRKQFYFKKEAQLLKNYESTLQQMNLFLTVSMEDEKFFRQKYPESEHAFIPPFQPHQKAIGKTGQGNFALYHGNLQHPENEEAALYLLEHVFPFISFPIIVAGKNPCKEIKKRCAKLNQCTLIEDPDAATMESLISDAHIHLLPTFQMTGFKLKLLFALFAGRHVIANMEMLHGSGLEACCKIVSKPEEWIAAIDLLSAVPFTPEELERRNVMLSVHFDKQKNAAKMLTYLQPKLP